MNHLIKIVKEQGIAKMIMDMKNRMEHVEKYIPVLEELKQEMRNRKDYYIYEYSIVEYDGIYDEYFSVYNRVDMIVTHISKETCLTSDSGGLQNINFLDLEVLEDLEDEDEDEEEDEDEGEEEDEDEDEDEEEDEEDEELFQPTIENIIFSYITESMYFELEEDENVDHVALDN